MMRNLSIDWFKIILALFVVLLHLDILTGRIPWLGFLLCNGLFRIAVPIFLVISGYYFVSIDSGTKLKKWCFRLGSLYLIWMLIYLPLWIDTASVPIKIIIGYDHLWYLIGTLFAGVLLYVVRKLNDRSLLGISLFLFLIGFSMQWIGNLHLLNGKSDVLFNYIPLYRNGLFFCFPFMTIGFLLQKSAHKIVKVPTVYAVLSAVAVLLLEACLTYRLTGPGEVLDLLLSLYIVAPLCFLYVRSIRVDGLSKDIASFSIGIYLFHLYVIHWARPRQDALGEWQVMVVLGITFIGAFVLTILNRKLRYLL